MIRLPPTSFGVRYETQLCDRHGKVERVLQRGRNQITNWGMDQLASQAISDLIQYLVLSDTTDTRKRVMPGGTTLTVTYTSPTNIAVVASANFFVSGDAGNTLALPGGVPELKITTYTDATHVTCQAPSGEWLPGFSPPAPSVYSQATVYYTSVNTLANYFTQLNTYDTGGQTESTDASNSQFIHGRIFLSGVVSGSNWTVRQLGWSDGNGSHNIFGVAQLSSADVIPIGKRYRVIMSAYSGYTPIDLSAVTVDWGSTIGSYTMNIRQEYIGHDTPGGTNNGNFLQPHRYQSGSGVGWTAYYKTASHVLVPAYWQGQTGGTAPSLFTDDTGEAVTLGAYTNGQFKRTKNVRWPDTVAITGATALAIAPPIVGGQVPILTLKPTSGTVSKPSGYWCDATFKVFWTRDLPT
jgi:hypothetical protein